MRVRQMRKDSVPLAWIREVVVAEAGCAANATLRLSTEYNSLHRWPHPRRETLSRPPVSRCSLCSRVPG